MKWFKHQSNARNDERLSRLEDKCGLEGYGFYFKMLEIVAEVIDITDRHEVTYSLSRWGRQANISTKKYLYLVQCCADVGLMLIQRDADDMTVKIPNLLKYRDNHTKNLQVTNKQDKEEDKEEDIDKELEKTKAKIPSQKAKAFMLPDWLPKDIWQSYKSHRVALRAALTIKAEQLAIEQLKGFKSLGYDPVEIINNTILNGWKGLFEPKNNRSQAPPNRQEFQKSTTELAKIKLFGNQQEVDITHEAVRV